MKTGEEPMSDRRTSHRLLAAAVSAAATGFAVLRAAVVISAFFILHSAFAPIGALAAAVTVTLQSGESLPGQPVRVTLGNLDGSAATLTASGPVAAFFSKDGKSGWTSGSFAVPANVSEVYVKGEEGGDIVFHASASGLEAGKASLRVVEYAKFLLKVDDLEREVNVKLEVKNKTVATVAQPAAALGWDLALGELSLGDGGVLREDGTVTVLVPVKNMGDKAVDLRRAPTLSVGDKAAKLLTKKPFGTLNKDEVKTFEFAVTPKARKILPAEASLAEKDDDAANNKISRQIPIRRKIEAKIKSIRLGAYKPGGGNQVKVVIETSGEAAEDGVDVTLSGYSGGAKLTQTTPKLEEEPDDAVEAELTFDVPMGEEGLKNAPLKASFMSNGVEVAKTQNVTLPGRPKWTVDVISVRGSLLMSGMSEAEMIKSTAPLFAGAEYFGAVAVTCDANGVDFGDLKFKAGLSADGTDVPAMMGESEFACSEAPENASSQMKFAGRAQAPAGKTQFLLKAVVKDTQSGAEVARGERRVPLKAPSPEEAAAECVQYLSFGRDLEEGDVDAVKSVLPVTVKVINSPFLGTAKKGLKVRLKVDGADIPAQTIDLAANEEKPITFDVPLTTRRSVKAVASVACGEDAVPAQPNGKSSKQYDLDLPVRPPRPGLSIRSIQVGGPETVNEAAGTIAVNVLVKNGGERTENGVWVSLHPWNSKASLPKTEINKDATLTFHVPLPEKAQSMFVTASLPKGYGPSPLDKTVEVQFPAKRVRDIAVDSIRVGAKASINLAKFTVPVTVVVKNVGGMAAENIPVGLSVAGAEVSPRQTVAQMTYASPPQELTFNAPLGAPGAGVVALKASLPGFSDTASANNEKTLSAALPRPDGEITWSVENLAVSDGKDRLITFSLKPSAQKGNPNSNELAVSVFVDGTKYPAVKTATGYSYKYTPPAASKEVPFRVSVVDSRNGGEVASKELKKTVGAIRDLAVGGVTVPDALVKKSGQKVPVKVVVQNKGETRETNIAVSLTADGVEVTPKQTVSALEPNAEQALTFQMPSPSADKRVALKASLAATDSNAANNESKADVDVDVFKNLVIKDIRMGTVGSNELQFVVAVKNEGAADCTGQGDADILFEIPGADGKALVSKRVSAGALASGKQADVPVKIERLLDAGTGKFLGAGKGYAQASLASKDDDETGNELGKNIEIALLPASLSVESIAEVRQTLFVYVKYFGRRTGSLLTEVHVRIKNSGQHEVVYAYNVYHNDTLLQSVNQALGPNSEVTNKVTFATPPKREGANYHNWDDQVNEKIRIKLVPKSPALEVKGTHEKEATFYRLNVPSDQLIKGQGHPVPEPGEEKAKKPSTLERVAEGVDEVKGVLEKISFWGTFVPKP
jgi:hypothetical protein